MTMKLAELEEALKDARARRRVERTAEACEAVIAAWNALVAASPRQKAGRPASRAGLRQQRERREVVSRRVKRVTND